MRRLLPLLAVALMSAPAFGQAPCYADYKARTVEPLRLHYGTIELHEACDASSAASEIAGRIARDGWQLLEVVGIFDADGLQEREADAGAYHLRY